MHCPKCRSTNLGFGTVDGRKRFHCHHDGCGNDGFIEEVASPDVEEEVVLDDLVSVGQNIDDEQELSVHNHPS